MVLPPPKGLKLGMMGETCGHLRYLTLADALFYFARLEWSCTQKLRMGGIPVVDALSKLQQ